MLHPNQVAKYFIFKSIPGTNENITNLKLQKLLYFAQGHFLAKHGLGNPLFEEEIKAWAHGPVVPEIYRLYSDYKFMEINKSGTENMDAEIEENYKKVLDAVWETYKSYNGKELEKKTHEEGPWKDIRGDLPPFISTNITIPKKDIYNHFNTVTV
ncbi:Panacea domain-containing protein [Peribacillus phoenicis]|uniref:Panacea domain-containing protein n=1 Tax=unclassified Peribacillus TaxID=2675266 RepID=UPI0039A20B95